MLRTDILNEITSLTGESTDFYEMYSTSQLKKILDDIKTVNINTSSVNNSILLLGLVAAIIVLLISKK